MRARFEHTQLRAPHAISQENLFGASDDDRFLPENHAPRKPAHLTLERIVLARSSTSTPQRRRFVEAICAVYPDVKIVERYDTPHNRIKYTSSAPLRRHYQGKRTLVFGELRDTMRFSEEEGNTCPNYWHFSTYGSCPYGCKYCYLAGTPGVWFSPSVKIYVNLREIMGAIDCRANAVGRPIAFYLGKLQDGLALDPLTGFSNVLVPFFARHPHARQVVLTKCADMKRLLDLDHGGHTILSWSLNPPEIASRFEENTPSVEERIAAMHRCAEVGYPLRAVIMPVIPVEGWQTVYTQFAHRLLERVPLQRLTVGGICIYRKALTLMERKMGRDNCISRNLERRRRLGDGRLRYPLERRVSMYRVILDAARDAHPDIELALCLEEAEVWRQLGIESRMGKCNCVL